MRAGGAAAEEGRVKGVGHGQQGVGGAREFIEKWIQIITGRGQGHEEEEQQQQAGAGAGAGAEEQGAI